ncbi:GxxExxY protein [Pontiella sp.]|uniref:GxxExxY protein n=1 Tax=Pontiella sp. TaxID=2837462 RepID=UPI003562158D
MTELLYRETTEKVIGAAFEVYRELGYGFLEKVYQKAMVHELTLQGVKCEEEPPTPAIYKGVKLLDYFGDLLVEDIVMVELKAHKVYQADDEAQLLNELKTSDLKVGMLINFGRDGVKFKRMVF